MLSKFDKRCSSGIYSGLCNVQFFLNIFNVDIESTLYNYADDNTVSYADYDPINLKTVLENDSKTLIKWFHINKMKANPDKFQAFALDEEKTNNNLSLSLGSNINIKCEKEVKLLCATIDLILDFNNQTTKMYRKAARQPNVLERIGHHLNRLSKITIYYSFIMSNFSSCPLT